MVEIVEEPAFPNSQDQSQNEAALPSAHRKLRDDCQWLKETPIKDINIVGTEALQDQFKKWSSVLSILRHQDQDNVDIHRNKPIAVPDDVQAARMYFKSLIELDELVAVAKRYLSLDLSDDPGKMNVLLEDPKDLRTQIVRLIMRIIACVGDIADPRIQSLCEQCISTVGSSAVNETGLIAVGRLCDNRRRLGTTIKPLNTSQSLMTLMESILHLLDQPNLISMVRHVLVLLWILLIADKERSDEDAVDAQSVIRSLVHPYLSGPTQAEWYIGVMAMNYLVMADRKAAKEFVFMSDLTATLLGLCAAHNQTDNRLQTASLTLIMALIEFNEIRMLLLQNGIIDILSSVCMLQSKDIHTNARVAACLARLSLHDEETRKKIFDEFEFFDITKEILTVINPDEIEINESNLLTQLVLEVVFFLSLHSKYKAQLVTALADHKDGDLIKTEDKSAMLKAPLLVKSLPKFGAAAFKSGNSLCQYTYCGILANLTRSSEDKERLKRQPGMPNWDDEQMDQVQMMMERLPDNAKPVSNGKFDRGDDSLITELVSKLIESDALRYVCNICAKPSISPALAAMGANAIRQCITKQSSNRGAIVKLGGFSTLLNACHILNEDKDFNVTSADELRLIRQSLAQLAIGVNPKSMSYREKLDLVPHMMSLLTDRHQLFNYEGLLVLTNISSDCDEVRDRILYHKDGWQTVVNCAFEDHDELRAAGVELMANMSNCDLLLDRIAQGKYLTDIQFLMACCQEVTNDRCLHASAGALAMLSRDLRVATVILERLPNINTIFEVLQICVAKKDPALLVRIAVFMRNLVHTGVEQYRPYGSKKVLSPELKKQWETVQPVVEFVLNALSNDLLALIQNQQVAASFKAMQMGFTSAMENQRKMVRNLED